MGAELRITVLSVLVACNGDGAGTTSTTGTAENTSSTTGSSVPTDATDPGTSASEGSSTGFVPDVPSEDPLDDYKPCADGCALDGECIASETASICGSPCHEYGPGSAPGRCENSPPLRNLCPLGEEIPGLCILGCETAEDCPAPGMMCIPCPEPFVFACEGLNPFLGFNGSSMCAWPNP